MVTPARPGSVCDGNEAAAWVAYRLAEVIAIYPITPSTPMGEWADKWSSDKIPNLWGVVPRIIEMQSEGGVAGAVHGAVTAGSLATTFTSSQGLLLMIPNMYKIAGELTPVVIHVAARTVATHALSIFGDHSDVMGARSTGWAMLCSSSVQEAQDFALVSHAATLKSHVPFLHFFDGFRTSHEMNKIDRLEESDLLAMVDEADVRGHAMSGLSPDRPLLRGSSQNPDVFFQAREAANLSHDRVAAIVEEAFERLRAVTGRDHRLFEYVGHPEAERVIVMMGSAVGAAGEAVESMANSGDKVGMIKVRLYRPFSAERFVAALPATTRRLAVLDRTKEPGSTGDPLYLDVLASLAERSSADPLPTVIGGRYGLSSKEFTPAMAAAVLDELKRPRPKRHFTVGIEDDVTRMSLEVPPFVPKDNVTFAALIYGLGSDGTVSAGKSTVKIVGEGTSLNVQGHFVYDSKKSGQTTACHLRFSEQPIRSTYLVAEADFVGCNQSALIRRFDVLKMAKAGATFLLNSPYNAGEVWGHLPIEVQERIISKQLRFFVLDGSGIARKLGLGLLINTAMQAAFFASTSVIPLDQAIEKLKSFVREAYDTLGQEVVERNIASIDLALGTLSEVDVPATPTGSEHLPPLVAEGAPEFVHSVTAKMMAGEGDQIPVSAFRPGGSFATATARWEKRGLASALPIWDPDLCIDCAKCVLVCPHAALRMKVVEKADLSAAPEGFRSKEWRGKDFGGHAMVIQVAPDDCTGCSICVDVCPVHDKDDPRVRSINMEPIELHLDRERRAWDHFLELPEMDRTVVKIDTIKGSQLLQPLFEFSGACAGCGETPYLKLLSQMFGDRILIANATGCSSIYGGNLPTTPWATDREGRGPAWSNSLFEDDAEFGLGMRLALDQRSLHARDLLSALRSLVGEELVAAIETSRGTAETDIRDQRARVKELRRRLKAIDPEEARTLEALCDDLVPKSVWIVGGDGWAYDIGYGGLDHVLASGEDVNILVLDTQVYSNTGGQASKATPRGAGAKFASMGKRTRRKDLGRMAMSYGGVYVAQIAMGADNAQAVRALADAQSFHGPSLVIAYGTCIEHGIQMPLSMSHQSEAVSTGFWPLYRYDPRAADDGRPILQLDSRRGGGSLRDFVSKEVRYSSLARSDPEGFDRMLDLLQQDIDDQWRNLAVAQRVDAVSHTAPTQGA